MDIKRALELRLEYSGNCGKIRVNNYKYICLNDIMSFFPDQDLSNWIRSPKTVLFCNAVNRELNSVESTEYQVLPLNGIMTTQGRNGGTWAHRWIAFELMTWLSPEFKLKVIKEYEDGTQRKQDWNIKRILAANNYMLMCEAIKNDHDPIKPYHYSNEALMINEIVLGSREGIARDSATEIQLNDIATLEGHNATMIALEMDYQSRKVKLKELFDKSAKEKRL